MRLRLRRERKSVKLMQICKMKKKGKEAKGMMKMETLPSAHANKS